MFLAPLLKIISGDDYNIGFSVSSFCIESYGVFKSVFCDLGDLLSIPHFQQAPVDVLGGPYSKILVLMVMILIP